MGTIFRFLGTQGVLLLAWRLAGKHVYVHIGHLQNVYYFGSSGCDGFLFDENIYKGVSGHTPV